MVGKRFVTAYPLEGAASPGPSGPGVSEWLAAWGGRSFGGGIYRLLTQEQVAWADAHIAVAFPELMRRASSFGYDWLGRLFATDKERIIEGEASVLLIDPGAGEFFYVPVGFSKFHDVELAEEGALALEAEFFEEWRSTGGATPGLSECVGYRVPLFLSGADAIENLELTDLDVYWSLSGQLGAQFRRLPPGTPISGVSIS